jgi:hypothetical protein
MHATGDVLEDGQKLPAGQGCIVAELLQYDPAAHGAAEEEPAGQYVVAGQSEGWPLTGH